MGSTLSENRPMGIRPQAVRLNPSHDGSLDMPGMRGMLPMLRLVGKLGCLRHEPQKWRLELLNALIQLLPAAVAATYIVRIEPKSNTPHMLSVMVAGLKAQSEREAFFNEFTRVPFQDPLSRRVIKAARETSAEIFTAARQGLVDDQTWFSSPSVRRVRRGVHIDDCVFSATKPREVGNNGELLMMAICAFRSWDDPVRFSDRERKLLDVLHAGMEWIYMNEEDGLHVTRITTLTPQLRQTLDLLLAGYPERQAAEKMAISFQAFHENVRALYVRFGVRSRGELMAKWIA